MVTPKELKYARTHEWVRVEGELAFVGITDYAQESLGDIVYVEPPEAGQTVKQGEEVATIESVKATMDLITPVSGEVTEVNAGLNDAPEKVNQDPYGEGWMIVVTMSNPAELDSLLSAADYKTFTETEAAG